VFLEPGDDEKMQTILKEIREIVDAELPPLHQKTKMCRNCSYGDICWV
ncbi:MAG: Dna2/Cas4 domain-containing protein, partial [Candidatus Brocadiaceae bacterium]